MNFLLFNKLCKIELKYFFRGRWSVVFYLFGIVVNLLVYFYTSEAFSPNVNVKNVFLEKGYFEYIILGEILLVLISSSFNDGQNVFLRYRDSGFLLQSRFSSLGIFKFLFMQYSISFLLSLPFVFFSMLFGKLFFGLSLNLTSIFVFVLLFFVSLVMFYGIFLLNISSLVFFGKRNQVIGHGMNLFSFFSGAYFPLEILKNQSVVSFLQLSPFSSYVKFSRELIYFQRILISDLGIVLLFCLISFLIGFIYLNKVFKSNSMRLYELS